MVIQYEEKEEEEKRKKKKNISLQGRYSIVLCLLYYNTLPKYRVFFLFFFSSIASLSQNIRIRIRIMFIPGLTVFPEPSTLPSKMPLVN